MGHMICMYILGKGLLFLSKKYKGERTDPKIFANILFYISLGIYLYISIEASSNSKNVKSFAIEITSKLPSIWLGQTLLWQIICYGLLLLIITSGVYLLKNWLESGKREGLDQ